MGIAQKLVRNFNDAVRVRGQAYFAKGRVSLLAAKANEVVARVRGTTKYRVRLRLRGTRLLAMCNCPYFSPQGDPCKHLWATLLLAEARGLLQTPPLVPIKLVSEAPRRPAQQQQHSGDSAGASGPDDYYREREPGHGPGSGMVGNRDQEYQDREYRNRERERGHGQVPGRGPGVGPGGRPVGPGGRPVGPGVGPGGRPVGPGVGPGGRPVGPAGGPSGPGGAANRGGRGRQTKDRRGRGGHPGPGPGAGVISGIPESAGWGPRGGGPGQAGSSIDRRAARAKAAAAGASSAAARSKATPANRNNAKRLLVYILDVTATLAQNQIVIDLARRQRKPTGEWGPLRPWWYAPRAAHVKYDPEDRLILALLDEAQGTSPQALYASGAVVTPVASPVAASATATTPSTVVGQAASATAMGTRPEGEPGQGANDGDEARAANGMMPRPFPARTITPRRPTSSELRGTRRFVLRKDHASLVERLARTGRLRLRRTEGEDDPPTVRWDDGQPWRFNLDLRSEMAGKRWAWRGWLRRGKDRMDLSEPLVLLPGLLVLGVGRAARFDDLGVMPWIVRLRYEKEITFVEPQQDLMLGRIFAESRVPPAELVDSIPIDEIIAKPRPSITLRTPRQNWGLGADKLIGELEFDYDGAVIPAGRTTPLAVSTELGLVIRRDPRTESSADIKLFELGFREAKDPRLEPGTLELPAKRLQLVTKELVQAGWRVEAEGKLIRAAGEFKMSVTTNIDWFELDGGIDYGGQNVSLPELLSAVQRGESMIELGDGSMGMLPEEWLKKYGLMADLGTSEGGSLRFSTAQAGILDALLASQPEIRVDEAFAKVRENLRKFEGIQPIDSPPGFHGELRPYQREGLGWLDYLQRFGFGGILADDMGLGKTIQVLALLQRRRFRRQAKGPTLVVVPRSLVFNWNQESAKFTPRLRVLDYTGPGRHVLRAKFSEHDLIITTYGTLRTDIAELANIDFDYIILDEAQAIKNAESQSAKSARLLKGKHRLAISGTPIENHLGELWSIFEFLNPGMLGADSVFKRFSGSGSSGLDESERGLLAKALKPFVLRRTKQQVVDDLPDKTEQTLYCDMEAEQQKLYDELRAHYRDALLRKDTAELDRSKIEVLEALLRLRQASCHPGLISPERMEQPSAKLDLLIPSIAEVVEEKHKVLVFSQFTSFLSIVRDRLDKEGLTYEYLDGRTRNRAARVERFQTDPDCPIFLISLKAGGLGLNLTAAEYVYLLDPWWNPAVEAQAIDRSHRIGQTQHVFAYRLICRGTVEEKILELQQKKRDLADAILNADNRLISSLTREDLEFLLS